MSVLRRTGEAPHHERVSGGRRVTSFHRSPISISLNDERGTGGWTRLARLLDWHHSTVWRKLNDQSPITQSDDPAGDGEGALQVPCKLHDDAEMTQKCCGAKTQ